MSSKLLTQHSIQELRNYFEEKILLTEFTNQPERLYEPIHYIMQLGGKRVRPVCTLAAAELFGGSTDDAINQAIAVEVFHNFTLVHDDIMDEAPLRRGHATVHKKWDENTGILSGDAMMILAYQYLSKNTGERFEKLFSNFNRTAIQVCEGQQYDMDFEQKSTVSLDEYLGMIELKTAVLLGESLRLGATIAGASDTDLDLIFEFGKNFGIAFQLQDDILDLYGDPEKFGKQVGGDVIACKKTYLFAKAHAIANENQKNELVVIYNDTNVEDDEKIEKVKTIFDNLDIRNRAKADMNTFYVSAGIALNSISAEDSRKKILKDFAESLMVREL
jgi:geranylgeranyl diphosphate synthase type II